MSMFDKELYLLNYLLLYVFNFLDSSGINLVTLFCTRSNLTTCTFLFGQHNTRY